MIRKCSYCDKDISHRHGKAKFCATKCRNDHYYKRDKSSSPHITQIRAFVKLPKTFNKRAMCGYCTTYQTCKRKALCYWDSQTLNIDLIRSLEAE